MQRLEVSGAVRPIYGSLGFKRLTTVPPRSPLKYVRMLYLFIDDVFNYCNAAQTIQHQIVG